MSVLVPESYSVVRDLVTDVKVLSTEERNHILWYACDRGDLSMVKSVIRAGCDVDHFHRGHTPLMMASIRGHDDVVKELILAGCKVDLPSSKCFIGWFRFITKMALAWPSLVVWAMVTLFVVMGGCYWLVVLTIALDFLSRDSFKVSGILRMKSRTKVMAWAGIVPAVVLVCIWRATAEEAQVVGTTVPVSMTVLVPVLMAVTGIGVITVLKGVTDTGAGAVTAVLAVAGAGIGAWFEAGAEIETLVRTGTVGMVVTVTGILALALTVAKAGTEALPLLFGAIMTVVVTTVGTWGLALGDAFLQPDAVSMTSAVPAIGILALPLYNRSDKEIELCHWNDCIALCCLVRPHHMWNPPCGSWSECASGEQVF